MKCSIKRPAKVVQSVPSAISAAACAALTRGSIKTSSPYIVIGTPLLKTIAAASGSCQTLNSAAGVALPDDAEPPIKTIRSSFAAVSGYERKKSAIFVSGASGTRVTGPSAPSTRSRNNSTAGRGSSARVDAGVPKSPSPSLPWMYSA